jgi:hypothetical protein
MEILYKNSKKQTKLYTEVFSKILSWPIGKKSFLFKIFFLLRSSIFVLV